MWNLVDSGNGAHRSPGSQCTTNPATMENMQGTAEENILGAAVAAAGGGQAEAPPRPAGDARRSRNALFRALHRCTGVRPGGRIVAAGS